ncbi:response regulator transcription factor [Cohnella sp. 56]|uniref:response regulator transcription factor n=1 Tax=Cohnella sp. 56 TaxID=3113722 RepID=UPI0030E794A4
MYNVLIADDSTQLRNGLKCLIDWPATGFRVGGEAASGKEALELLSGRDYHVLLTDIQMPGMDGIELIRQCAAAFPELEIVIISGYDDFAYARTAIQYGIADYLLKPVVRSELIQVLDKLRGKLEERSQDKTERSLMKWKLNQNVLMLREQFVLQLVNGTVNDGAVLDQRASQLQLDGILHEGGLVQFIGAEMRIPPGRLEGGGRQGQDRMRLAFQMLCREIAHAHGDRMIVFHDYNFANMMFFIVRLGGERDSYVLEAAKEIQDSLGRYLRIEAKLGVGRPCSPFAGLKTGYLSCLFSWSRSGAAANLPVDGAADEAWPSGGEWLPELEKRLTLALEKEDGEAFALHYRSLFPLDKPVNPLEDFIRIMRVVMLLGSVGRKYNHNAADIQDYTWVCYYSIWKFESPEDIFKNIMRLAEYVIGTIRESKKSGTAVMVDAIRDYIDNNYAYELSLSLIAEDFHLNETYLSKIFKKQIGKTFSEYILEVRMTQAVKLLLQSELRLDDIAGLVGFSNASYFSNVFKKHYGCSPTAYRSNGGSPAPG